VKEQQDAQIRNLVADVERMRGQKLALEARITVEQEKFKERRAKWLEEKKALQAAGEQARKQAYELRSQAKRQAQLIAQKDKQVFDSKMKLRDGQKELVDKELMLEKQRRWVDKELKRNVLVKETNARLEEDLVQREKKVTEMELAIEERHLLSQTVTADSSTAEEKESVISELNERIESLEMQIEFDTDRIECTQEDIDKQGLGSGETEAVDKFDELEEAKAALKAMFETVEQFQMIEERNKMDRQELRNEQVEKEDQIKDLQARLLLAEKEYDSRMTNIQREHEARLLVMLAEVENTHKGEEGEKEVGSEISTQGPLTGDQMEKLEKIERLLSVKDEQNAILQEQHDYYQEMGTELRQKLVDAEDRQCQAEAEASEAKHEVEDMATQVAKLNEELSTGRGRARSATSAVLAQLEGLGLEGEEGIDESEAIVNRLVVDGEDKIGSFVQKNLEDLETLWTNIGLPTEEQTRLRVAMIRPVVRLCEGEASRNKQHELELKEEKEELEAMMETQDVGFQEALKNKLGSGGKDGKAMALWESVHYLRSEGHNILKETLEELRKEITANKPGDGKKIKWRVRWTPDPIDREILDGTLRPSKTAFERLATRKAEVDSMVAEASLAILEYTKDLNQQWDVLKLEPEKRQSILSKAIFSKGGFNAVHEMEKLVEEAKAEVRLKLRSEKVKLSELWIEVKKSGKEQDDFLANVTLKPPIQGLEMIQAEVVRVQGVINSMKDIIKMIAVRESLSAKIAEFEIAAKNPDRLKGNSAKLMKEEKERKLFARKNDRICVELITKIEEWEREMRMPFMYRGMHYKHVLQAEQTSLNRSGSTSLVRQTSAERLGLTEKDGTPSRPSTAVKATPGSSSIARPSSAVSVKERTAARRLSGSGTGPASDRKKQLEDWRTNNDKKKEAASASKEEGKSVDRKEAVPTRRRLSVGKVVVAAAGDSKLPPTPK